MRALLLLIIFWVKCLALNAQSLIVNERTQKVEQFKTSSINQLTEFINANCQTEEEKLSAVYLWIGKNIKYDVDNYLKTKFSQYGPEKTMQKKTGLCYHYAELFSTLANQLKIPCIVISGYTKNAKEIIRKPIYEDHSWNIVRLNQQYFAIDITWGAGFLAKKENTKKLKYLFKTQLNSEYFLADPKLFIQTHYPALAAFQLLAQPISMEGFCRNMPDSPLNYQEKNIAECFDAALLAYKKENALFLEKEAALSYPENHFNRALDMRNVLAMHSELPEKEKSTLLKKIKNELRYFNSQNKKDYRSKVADLNKTSKIGLKQYSVLAKSATKLKKELYAADTTVFIGIENPRKIPELHLVKSNIIDLATLEKSMLQYQKSDEKLIDLEAELISNLVRDFNTNQEKIKKTSTEFLQNIGQVESNYFHKIVQEINSTDSLIKINKLQINALEKTPEYISQQKNYWKNNALIIEKTSNISEKIYTEALTLYTCINSLSALDSLPQNKISPEMEQLKAQYDFYLVNSSAAVQSLSFRMKRVFDIYDQMVQYAISDWQNHLNFKMKLEELLLHLEQDPTKHKRFCIKVVAIRKKEFYQKMKKYEKLAQQML